MLNENQKKMIRRYYLFPIWAKTCFFTALLLGIPWILCEMINDLVFMGVSKTDTGPFLYLAFTSLYTILAVIFFLIPRMGMTKKPWLDLVEKANVSLENGDYTGSIAMLLGTRAAGSLLGHAKNEALNKAGAAFDAAAVVGSAVTVHQMTKETSRNAKVVATVLDVSLPKARNSVLAYVLIPLLLVIGVYIPNYASAKQIVDAQTAQASQAVEQMVTTLESGCAYVYSDDPQESYRSYGYSVSGHLYERDTNFDSYISIKIDNDGKIYEVNYSIDVDIEADKEVNLEHISSDLATLNQLMTQSGVSASSHLLKTPLLPDDFIAAFTEQSYYEDISVTIDDTTSLRYNTDSKEDYNQYSSSYIFYTIKDRNN